MVEQGSLYLGSGSRYETCIHLHDFSHYETVLIVTVEYCF